jgi:ribosome maturation factor RimP
MPLYFFMANAKSLLIEQIEQIAAPVLAEHAAELVDLQFVHEHGQWILRFFLDKENGITLDDCAVISEHVGRILDATDVIKQRYSLEVSSPGINRPLKKEADYQRFLGERVDVTLYAPLNGRRHFKGKLQSVSAGVVVLEAEPQQVFALPLADVAKANLDRDIHF